MQLEMLEKNYEKITIKLLEKITKDSYLHPMKSLNLLMNCKSTIRDMNSLSMIFGDQGWEEVNKI